MADNRYTSYDSIATVLSSDLDGSTFTNNSKKISASIDNTSLLHFWDDVELACTFAATPSANATVELYLIQSVDGTNFTDGSTTIDPPTTSLIGVFPIRATTSAQRVSVRGVQLSPGLFKYLVINKTGVASSGTSNTLKRRPYSTQSIVT